MTNNIATLLATVLLSVSALAQPVITSVTPASGPDTGGTLVVITGRGFSTCIICSPPTPPSVSFGGTPATSSTLVSETRIEAIAPPHLTGAVDVVVQQYDGEATLPKAFRYEASPGGGFEMILLPSFSRTVHGAFGSEFRTTVRVANKGDAPALPIYGVDETCLPGGLPRLYESGEVPYYLQSLESRQISTECSLWPARLLYVPKARADAFTMNTRVTDVSRLALSHGTEIPAVRSDEIVNDRIVLLGVPLDSRFRNTLRIYSPWQTEIPVKVTINGRVFTVMLQPGHNRFEPAYAEFSDFPRPGDLPLDVEQVYSVTIDPPPTMPIALLPYEGAPIWAFISVTNNETQQITIITPD
jgi:hypothetical protein